MKAGNWQNRQEDNGINFYFSKVLNLLDKFQSN